MRQQLLNLRNKTVHKAHLYCIGRLCWYKKWDEHPYSYHIHWGLLIIFLIGLIVGLALQLWLLPPK